MASPQQEPKHWLIIPAAGIGSRMGAALPKQYLSLDGKTILQRTIEALVRDIRFESVLVGLSSEDTEFLKLPASVTRNVERFEGGAERVSTVLNGLQALQGRAQDNDWVWVHDAARPLVSSEELKALECALRDAEHGALLALQATDTMKCVDEQGNVTTMDRNCLWRAQTPQAFRYALLYGAIVDALEQNSVVTDESSAMELAGKTPVIVPGKASNIKVTHPEDMVFATQGFSGREGVSELTGLRVGSGYDVHAFEEGEFVTLGGVKIPYHQGLRAHSDGDVLLHALCDAILGALALGDIGHHFPDTDPKWAGANSRDLLRGVFTLMKDKGFAIGNVDSTIIAQAPKMAPYIESMRKHIAEDLEVELSAVSVKATTTEQLGFTGRKEGIAAQSSVLLVKE